MDITKLKQALAADISSVCEQKFGVNLSADVIAEMIEYPPNPEMGDLSLPCFKLSRELKKAPPAIAAALAEGFECGYVKGISADGGYLNFRIADIFYSEVLDEVGKNEKYGSSDIGRGKTVLFDYSSPNVAKPFHIGHLGTTVIGHSLKMIHEYAGYTCVGINHLGDWGTQFGKLIVAYRKWGDREKIEKNGLDELVAIYVKFHAEAEKDPSLDDEARAEFTKLENGDGDNHALWQWFVDLSIKEYKQTYEQLGIVFDSYAGESFYHDKTDAVIKELGEKGLLKQDDGATLVPLDEYGMPPFLVLKSDGSTLYAVRDIAAALYRKNTYDFYKSVYVTSAGQSLHFAQLFKVVSLMGYDWSDSMLHVPYGTVSIDGAKLSTRSGNVVLLRDLFSQASEKVLDIINEKNPDLENKESVAEQVGVGAIVFHYLSNSRIKDINFRLDDVLSFEGNTGPYAQYTYARTRSVLDKAGEYDSDCRVLTAPEEKELLYVISRFGEVVLSALETSEPMAVTRYILDLCAAFNRFYHECRILSCEDKEVRSTRIALTSAAGRIIKNALGLICLKTPEKI